MVSLGQRVYEPVLLEFPWLWGCGAAKVTPSLDGGDKGAGALPTASNQAFRIIMANWASTCIIPSPLDGTMP